ncbi:MAG: 30S ribosomal protein S16 [Roseiflexaceae bacterium]|nr:30S ribosomal protein S16 [Roseiflexaceae bacterium]
MVRIRLRRTGKTKQPSYRVVIADARSPRDGKFIEVIGHYSPTRQPKVLEIKGDRARYWLGVGAQPSDTVTYLLKKVNVLDENGKVIATAPAAATEPVELAATAPAAATEPVELAATAPAPRTELVDVV